jgi:predicted ArsR family transcriptional regulator
MPARNDTQRRSKVYQWLLDQGGKHRPVDIAKALDIETHKAATDCIALFRQGRVNKVSVPPSGTRTRPITTWEAIPQPEPETVDA